MNPWRLFVDGSPAANIQSPIIACHSSPEHRNPCHLSLVHVYSRFPDPPFSTKQEEGVAGHVAAHGLVLSTSARDASGLRNKSLEPEVVEWRAEGHALTERGSASRARGSQGCRAHEDGNGHRVQLLREPHLRVRGYTCEYSQLHREHYKPMLITNAWDAAWQGSAVPTRTLRSQPRCVASAA